jgi:hypothetical protein
MDKAVGQSTKRSAKRKYESHDKYPVQAHWRLPHQEEAWILDR